MAEDINTVLSENLPRPKSRISKLAIASLVVGILVIPLVVMSLHDETIIYSLNHLFSGSSVSFVSAECEILHSFCFILPALSVLLGLAALVRIALSRKRLRGYTFAIVGIAVSLISVAIYVDIILSRIFQNMW
jgi:hypothetical protein